MKILIGQGSCGIATGARKTMHEFERLLKNTNVEILPTGCIGICYLEPIVDVYENNKLVTRYVKVTKDKVLEIVEEHIKGKNPVSKYAINMEEQEFLNKQERIALKNCGLINPEDIDEYINIGGYNALEKAMNMGGEKVCNEINDSLLRGRGGGGYPTGKKWLQVRKQKELIKYVVCNADEGDPGAFMDRSIMEGDPHKMLEGMIIAGLATNSCEGYIYVRAEYPLAVSRLRIAIKQAEKEGYLGKNILGSNFSFNIKINLGAGAFVCGEGSALTASIEGNRGMPRVKPPRTVEQGLFGKPTVLNNVETFANVPEIINMTASEYRKIGTEKSPGTKAFALTGNVNKTGLIEVPMGTSLKTIIFDIGGGVKGDKDLKAVQIGGPSGGCLTKEHLDIPLDFDSLKEVGAMIGSGGLVVMDENTCMVSIAKYFMDFTQNESCGKCVPCREGTHVMNELLDDIVTGNGSIETLDMLMDLADTISEVSLCGLGKTAPSPVVSTINQFRSEYEAHILDKICPTNQCPALRTVMIKEEICIGCSLCKRVCPVWAIDGELKGKYTIDKEKCIKCMACIGACKFEAIVLA